jgi:hypothetical protein
MFEFWDPLGSPIFIFVNTCVVPEAEHMCPCGGRSTSGASRARAPAARCGHEAAEVVPMFEIWDTLGSIFWILFKHLCGF